MHAAPLAFIPISFFERTFWAVHVRETQYLAFHSPFSYSYLLMSLFTYTFNFSFLFLGILQSGFPPSAPMVSFLFILPLQFAVSSAASAMESSAYFYPPGSFPKVSAFWRFSPGQSILGIFSIELEAWMLSGWRLFDEQITRRFVLPAGPVHNNTSCCRWLLPAAWFYLRFQFRSLVCRRKCSLFSVSIPLQQTVPSVFV